MLVDHFFINTEEMLDTAVYMGFDAGILHMFFDLRHDPLNKGLPDAALLGDLLLQLIISLRLQIL